MNEELILKILENQASILSMLTKLDNKIDTVKEELRAELKAEMTALHNKLRSEMYSIRNEFQAQITSLEKTIKTPLSDITLMKYALEGVKIEIQKTREELHDEIQELAAVTQEKLNYTFDKIKSLS